MKYKLKYRRKLFWKSYVVRGHSYDANQDKMILFLPDGGVQEIANWKSCEIKLGQDWVVAQQKQMEKQSGQHVPVNVEDN